MFQRSFLKWAGGKYSALPNILKHIPIEGDVLVEPFVGSATVALNTNYKKYILGDLNQDLINLYRYIVKTPDATLQDALKLFTPKENTADAFYSLRAQYNASIDPYERALIFVYLNRHCYNGLIRYNQAGGFNAPFGDYKAPSIPALNWYFFAEKFSNARFVHGAFNKLIFHAKQGVTVYSDPPYLPASPTASFSAYTEEGFKKKDHSLLDRRSSIWSSRGASVWVSNHDVPLIDECYSRKADKQVFMVPRTISTSTNNRKPVPECLMEYRA